MNKIPFILLPIISLVGCGDKSSDDVSKNAELRLLVNVIQTQYESSQNAQESTLTLDIQLLEEIENSTNNKHVEISSKGIFTLDFNGKTYDLADYYFSRSGLGVIPEGVYRIQMPVLESYSQGLLIDLTLNNKNYQVETTAPHFPTVTNHSYANENYAPLKDDIYLDWTETTASGLIYANQIIQYTGNNSTNCGNSMNYDVTDNASSYNVTITDLNGNCDTNDEAISQVITDVAIKHELKVLSLEPQGFKQVTTNFINIKEWRHTRQF